MKKYFMRIAMPTVMLAVACMAFMATGCGRNGAAAGEGGDIPPSLVDRMRVSHNMVRNTMSGAAGSLDGEEMMALMRLGYGNAPEVAERPRGEMVFAAGGRSEEERRELWPFDVEAFERSKQGSAHTNEGTGKQKRTELVSCSIEERPWKRIPKVTA